MGPYYSVSLESHQRPQPQSNYRVRPPAFQNKRNGNALAMLIIDQKGGFNAAGEISETLKNLKDTVTMLLAIAGSNPIGFPVIDEVWMSEASGFYGQVN